jgi:hypothetical protein
VAKPFLRATPATSRLDFARIREKGHLVAALILPPCDLADTTITLGRRIARDEPIWQAHRTHF